MNELDGKTLTRADLVTGIVITALGLAVAILSAQMPTYAEQSGDLLTAPGIFPAIIGFVLLICGLTLTVRSVRRQSPDGTPIALGSALRVLASFVFMLLAVVAVGHVDFRIVAAGFTLVFCGTFLNWRVERAEVLRKLAAVAATVLIAAVAIPTLFQTVFLVRLP